MDKRSRANRSRTGPTPSKARVVRSVVQWLLIPGALFVVGYSLIGPRIGQVPALKASAEQVTKIVAGPREERAEPPIPPRLANRPLVSITVEPSDARRSRPRARAEEPKRTVERPARTQATEPAEPEPEPPEQDPASAAGAIPAAPIETPPPQEDDPSAGTGAQPPSGT